MDIKEYVEKNKQILKNEVLGLFPKPCLAIIQINNDTASNSYVKGKMKDASELGINTILSTHNENYSEAELLDEIRKYNNTDSVHGIIVQLPLPKHIDENKVKLAIDPIKDVDGFHPLSFYSPCTPKGIVAYLKDEGVVFQGQNAVVIGRSNIVGKPMAKLLLKENANVTVLHSKTNQEDMNFYLKHADIIVVAVGRKWFLDKQELKSSAVVVDVGINRENGVLYGDTRPGLKVRLQTPVPGGVGLLTRLNLMINLLEAYQKWNSK